MQHTPKKPGIDVIQEIIEDCLQAYPVSGFLIGLFKQYGQRGWLTKKQLQGLHAKASGVESISPGRLATLEAIIRKMPDRFKSALPQAAPLYEKNEQIGAMLDVVLQKYPQHKRALFLKLKYDNNEVLTFAEQDELKRFYKIATK